MRHLSPPCRIYNEQAEAANLLAPEGSCDLPEFVLFDRFRRPRTLWAVDEPSSRARVGPSPQQGEQSNYSVSERSHFHKRLKTHDFCSTQYTVIYHFVSPALREIKLNPEANEEDLDADSDQEEPSYLQDLDQDEAHLTLATHFSGRSASARW